MGQAPLQPPPQQIKAMLVDICSYSSADVMYDKLHWTITGSDEAVKDALVIISNISLNKRGFPYQIRVKLELANEHKEFVSGKKNGKINKIMGQSKVLEAFFS